MKKLLLSLMALMTAMTMANATSFELPCFDCPPGEDGLGWSGGSYNSETGTVTFESNDGLGFETGDLRGEDGVDGVDGVSIKGDTGDTGDTGATGAAGKDADVEAFLKLQRDAQEAIDFAVDSSAGNSAMAAIDFGSVCKGETAAGVGVGAAHSTFGSGVAGAVGAKHGVTDATAVVVKAWGVDENSYGGGLALVHKF